MLVLVAGVISWFAMPQEMFPLIELDRVTIKTEFKGAAPAEVERQVTMPIEEEFDALADIDSHVGRVPPAMCLCYASPWRVGPVLRVEFLSCR